MSRYIDADNMKSIKSIQSANFNTIETIREWIDEQPTADVRENVRGEWTYYVDREHEAYWGECNVCHKQSLMGGNFCPNCGAQMMRGGE